jgi:hypothetical protein
VQQVSPALARRPRSKPVQQQQTIDEKLVEIETSTVVRAAAATHRAVEQWSDEQDRRRNG